MIAKPSSPRFNLVEHIACELACVFYETGRSQGLKSVHKNAKHYAYANLERFVPHAIKRMFEMLNNPSTPQSQKDMIYESIMERVNDPMAQSLATSSNGHELPDIDIAKLIPVKELPTVIKDQRTVQDYGINPLWRKRRGRNN